MSSTPPDAPAEDAPAPAVDQPARIGHDEAFRRVYDAAKRTVGSRITVANVVVLITDVMRAVESVSPSAGLTGPEKKALATYAIETLINELVSEDSKDMVQAAVSMLLPGMIDAIVSAAKGQTGLAEPARRGVPRLFSCCFP